MRNALAAFEQNLDDVKELSSLHEYLTSTIKPPMGFDDILRFQIVYAVSAFDKLLHDLIRIGMTDTFLGKRSATRKYLSERLSMETHIAIREAAATSSSGLLPAPTEAQLFEQEITGRLKTISYQDPDKVVEGLGYIWGEEHKWQKIAEKMTENEKEIRTRLRLIVDRRNQIAHEADIDPATGKKYPIDKDVCRDTIEFLKKCGQAIVFVVS